MKNAVSQVNATIGALLLELRDMLELLTDQQYVQQIKLLSNATLGQHTRHIIEFFHELHTGYAYGKINYDGRKRDYRIENNRACAIETLTTVIASLEKEEKPLTLAVDYSEGSGEPVMINTNYSRELAYNLEHTVHHMALLRIGVNAVSTIALPPTFGVAFSTLKHRNACAQ